MQNFGGCNTGCWCRGLLQLEQSGLVFPQPVNHVRLMQCMHNGCDVRLAENSQAAQAVA